MAYSSLDIRETLRNAIGTSYYMNEQDVSCVTVTDDYNDTVYIPLLMPSEARSGNVFEMPFIEMNIVDMPSRYSNIGGDVRYQEAYIDFNLYYTNTDNITPETFGKAVFDELIDRLVSNRSSISGVMVVEVISDGREIIENDGKTIVFHRVLTIKANNYDNG